MIKRNISIFILIFLVFLMAFREHSWCFSHDKYFSNDSATPSIKKVYLKQNGDGTYNFCVDLADNLGFSPRIYTLPTGAKVILSFKKNVRPPKTPKLQNHKLLNGYFFEKISDCSMMLVVSFKEHVVFLEKSYTNNSMRLKFRIQKRHTVVIDAGHGGNDPGTRCVSGDFEKSVVLVAAIELRNMLVESGRYNVILTRDRDIFLPISRRKEIAGRDADFLISLHTDSNKDKNMRGMSVYTLPTLEFMKNKDAAYAIYSKKGNSDDHYKIFAKSRKFANTLVGYIPITCKLKTNLSRNSELKILTVPYPAILLGLGYVSNKVDNELIHLKEFREKVNRAILYALDESL